MSVRAQLRLFCCCRNCSMEQAPPAAARKNTAEMTCTMPPHVSTKVNLVMVQWWFATQGKSHWNSSKEDFQLFDKAKHRLSPNSHREGGRKW